MRYRLSFHAQEEMVIRDVSPATLDDVLSNPGQVIEQGPTKRVYQSMKLIAGRRWLIRVVVGHDEDPPVVITLYKTTQVDRYWKS